MGFRNTVLQSHYTKTYTYLHSYRGRTHLIKYPVWTCHIQLPNITLKYYQCRVMWVLDVKVLVELSKDSRTDNY